MVHRRVVTLLCLGGRDVADGFEQASVVEPVDPFERGVLDGFEGAPRPASMDDLGFVETVDGLGEGVVIAVAYAAHRRLDAGLRQALGVLDRKILTAAIAVMDQAAAVDGATVMDRLLQGVEDEGGMGRPADAPAHDVAGVDVDYEGHIDEARPGRDVGEVGDPEPVGRGRLELSVHLIQRTRRRLVAERRAHRLAADHALKAQVPHQPLDRATGDGEPLTPHLPPDLAHAVNTEVLGEDAQHLGPERFVTLEPGRTPGRIAAPGEMLMVGRRGDRQDPADRLDPVGLSVIVDEGDHRLNGRSSSACAK